MAVGVKGGQTLNDRHLAANVRTKLLKECQRILDGQDEQLKKELLMKMCTTLLPRLNEHSGEGGEPITVKIVNYGDNYTPPLPTETVSTTISESVG